MRLEMLAATFPEIADMRVLDLGGLAQFWLTVPVRPKHVTAVNLELQEPIVDWIEPLVGDACSLSEELLANPFDLVVSNSVIEHVGGHARREHFAQTIQVAARHHWVQTPYRYFPIEPHWLFPGQQFLPTPAKAVVSQRWTPSHIRSTDPRSAVADSLSVELLGVTEMRYYFPDSHIVYERFAGLVKSLIAWR